MTRSAQLRALVTHVDLDGKKDGLVGSIRAPGSSKRPLQYSYNSNRYNVTDFFEAEMIPGTGVAWTNPPGWGSPSLIGGLPGAGSSVFALGVGYTVVSTPQFQQSLDLVFGDYADLGVETYGPV